MIPKKMKLKRICQHSDREFVFTRGLNAFEGPNGSGKTNILQALCLALGQDTSLPIQKKSDMVQSGYERGDIFVEFEHRGIPGEIHVGLSRNYEVPWASQSFAMEAAKAAVAAHITNAAVPVTETELKLAVFKPDEKVKVTLTWGTVSLRKATEVSDWIRAEVGVDPKLIVSNYFPLQGDIEGSLSSDPQERQKAFSDRAGTALCEKIWTELGKELNAIQIPEGLDQVVAEAKTAAALAEGKVGTLENQFAHIDELERDTSKPQAIIDHYKRAREDAVRRSGLDAQLAQIGRDHEAAVRTEAMWCTKGIELKPSVDLAKGLRESANQRLSRSDLVAQREANRRKASADLNGAQQRLEHAVANPPQSPPSDSELSELSRVAGELNAKANNLRQWLEVFKTGKCPTCGKDVADHTVIEQMQVDLNKTTAEAQAASGRRQSLEVARQQLQASKLAWERSVAGLRATINQLTSVLASLPPPEEPLSPAEIEALQYQVRNAAELEQRLGDIRENYTRANTEVAKLLARGAEIMKQRDAIRVEDPGAEEAYQHAIACLLEAQTNQRTHAEALTELAVAHSRSDDAHIALNRAQERLALVAPQKAWKATVERVREVYHRDGLPAEVVAWYASELVRHTSNYLKFFEINFSVAIMADLTLMAIFPDKVMPVKSLSGGEKNVLNICMRLAMADLFPTDLGLLVLDEIEVHLDRANVAKLPIVLDKVKGLARSKGLVVLFVSHHPDLQQMCDNRLLAKEA
jgi:DNA repair exonuclease SbcCD ATPase subunit